MDPSLVRHEPLAYACPFCRQLRGEFTERNAREDIVVREPLAYARIAPKCWVDHPGNALVIPTEHVENLYRMTAEQNAAVFDLVRRVAVAMRSAYDCDGVSIRQHNEPAGNQDVWHLHVHVLPRRDDDRLYERHLETRWVDADERAVWARRLTAPLTGAD